MEYTLYYSRLPFVAVLLALPLSHTVLGAHTTHHLNTTWYEYRFLKFLILIFNFLLLINKLMGTKIMNSLIEWFCNYNVI